MMTIEEARAQGVCRVCGKKAAPRRVTPVMIDSFVLNYGKEYAHASCIGEPMTKVWAGFPRLMWDGVTDEGDIKLREPFRADDN